MHGLIMMAVVTANAAPPADPPSVDEVSNDTSSVRDGDARASEENAPPEDDAVDEAEPEAEPEPRSPIPEGLPGGVTPPQPPASRAPDMVPRPPLDPQAVADSVTGGMEGPSTVGGEPIESRPIPPGDTLDWVQTTSGEWLRGEFLSMRDRKVEFDSEELDGVSFDFADIDEVHVPGGLRVVKTNLRTVEGPTRIVGQRVEVITEDGPVRFMRKEILTLYPSTSSEWKKWKIDVTVGLNSVAGNSEQGSLAATADVRRRGDITRILFGYIGNLGYVSDIRNTHNHRGTARVDAFVTPDVFVIPASAIVLYDEPRNLETLLFAAAGAGWNVADLKRVEWDVSTALGYQYTSYISADPSRGAFSHDFGFRVGTLIDLDPTGWLDILFEWNSTLIPTDMRLTNHFFRNEWSFEATDILDFDITLIFNRLESPSPDRDGNVPVPNDAQFIVGLGLSFN